MEFLKKTLSSIFEKIGGQLHYIILFHEVDDIGKTYFLMFVN
jgi:hypothetical protein